MAGTVRVQRPERAGGALDTYIAMSAKTGRYSIARVESGWGPMPDRCRSREQGCPSDNRSHLPSLCTAPPDRRRVPSHTPVLHAVCQLRSPPCTPPPPQKKKRRYSVVPRRPPPHPLRLLQLIGLQDTPRPWRHLAPPQQPADVALARPEAHRAHEGAGALALRAHDALVLLVGVIVGNRSPKARPRAQLARDLAAAAAVFAPAARGGAGAGGGGGRRCRRR